MLTSWTLDIEFAHQDRFSDQVTPLGTVSIQLKDVLQGWVEKTAQSVVRVLDSYRPIMSSSAGVGKARIAIILEDMGDAAWAPASMIPGHVTAMRTTKQVPAEAVPEKSEADYQVMWELEVWKWAEQTKFKSHLKQIELETIEDVTKQW